MINKTIIFLRTIKIAGLILLFIGCQVLNAQSPTDRVDGGVSATPGTPAPIPESFETFTFTGTLSASDATRSDRLNRNGVASSCAAPKACDIFASGPFSFDEFSFTNPDFSNTVCVDVLLDATCTEGNIDVSIYDGSFDPANICSNHIADPGFSTGTPISPLSLSFDLAPSQTIVIVVSTPNSVGNGNSTCETGGGYEVTLSGDFDLTVPPTVPTMGEWALISLGMILLIFGVVALGQKRTAFA